MDFAAPEIGLAQMRRWQDGVISRLVNGLDTLPDIDFGDRVMDAAALEVPDIPEKLLLVGGGYIVLEMGTVYAALGSAVTLGERRGKGASLTGRSSPSVAGRAQKG